MGLESYISFDSGGDEEKEIKEEEENVVVGLAMWIKCVGWSSLVLKVL